MFLRVFITAAIFVTVAGTLVLNCNTLTAKNLHNKMIRFSRGMETGDVLTITGAVKKNAITSLLFLYPSFNATFAKTPVSLHLRVQFNRNSIIYNSFVGNRWGRREFGRLPFARGANYTISIVKELKKYRILHGKKEIKSFGIRHPVNWQMGDLFVHGDWSVASVSMTCVRGAETTSVGTTVTTATTATTVTTATIATTTTQKTTVAK